MKKIQSTKLLNNCKVVLTFTATFLLFSNFNIALAEDLQKTKELHEMSLEELMQLDVTTVSKRPQSLQNSAAAVFVISSDDIKNSTARNIPDLLRMVPGVNVAQFDGNKWLDKN